jgi:hypothetical protein
VLRRTRERLERLEWANRELGEKLDRVIEKLNERPAPATPEAATVLAQAFGQQAGAQAEIFKSFGELAMKASARRMGIRGGSTRARTGVRDDKGKFIPMKRVNAPQRQPDCPLCRDPSYSRVTIPMIQAHRQHEQALERAFAVYAEGNGHDSPNYTHARDTESPESGTGPSGQPPGVPEELH